MRNIKIIISKKGGGNRNETFFERMKIKKFQKVFFKQKNLKLI